MKTALASISAALLSLAFMALPAHAQQPAPRANEHGDLIPAGAAARLGTQSFRHADAFHLAMEPDGTSFVTRAGDAKFHRWDLATSKPLGMREFPDALAGYFSPDGTTAITVRTDGLWVWNIQPIAHRRHLVPLRPDTMMSSLAYSHDGKTAIFFENSPKVGGPPAQLVFLDLLTGKRTGAIMVTKGLANFAVSPDDRRIYVAGHKSLSCWERAGEKTTQIWEKVVDLNLVFLDPTGKTLLTFPREQKKPCRLWDAATGKERGAVSVDTEIIGLAVAFSPDGKRAAFDTPHAVELWDLAADKKIRSWPGGGGALLAFAPDGRTLVVCQGYIQAYDIDTGKPLYPDTREWGHARPVASLAWSPDSRYLASGLGADPSRFVDPSLFVWDVAAGKRLSRTSAPNSGTLAPLSFTFTAGSTELAGAGPAHDLFIWDSATGRVKSQTAPMQDGKKVRLAQPRFTQDGTKLFDLDPDTKTVSVRELPSGKLMWTRPATGGSVPFAATWDAVLALGADGHPRNLLTGKASPILQIPFAMDPHGVPFYSTDGYFVGSLLLAKPLPGRGNGDHFVYQAPSIVAIWERATGRMVRTLDLKGQQIGPMAFGPNNRSLAAVLDAKLQLHDLATDKIMRSIPTGRVNVLSISPDGRWAATSSDCTITLWDLRDGKKAPPAVLSAADLEQLWKDLGDSHELLGETVRSGMEPVLPRFGDAFGRRGVAAMWRLTEAGDQVLPMLAKRLPLVPHLAKGELAGLLRDLESEAFRVREPALRRLQALGERAEPALQAMLRGNPSLEAQRRIAILLEPLSDGRPPASETIRVIRAVQAVEQIGSPAAVRLLDAWSRGAEGARLTHEAQAALARRRSQN